MPKCHRVHIEDEGQCEQGKPENAGYDLIERLTRDNVTDIISVDVSESNRGYLHIHSRGYLQLHSRGYLQVHSKEYLHMHRRGYLQIHRRGYLRIHSKEYLQINLSLYLQIQGS